MVYLGLGVGVCWITCELKTIFAVGLCIYMHSNLVLGGLALGLGMASNCDGFCLDDAHTTNLVPELGNQGT